VGGKVDPDPREGWELCDVSDTNWLRSLGVPLFEPDTQYRWKPAEKRMTRLHFADGTSIELVAPEVDAPAVGSSIFVELAQGCIQEWHWDGHQAEIESLKNAKVFLTSEDCQAMADAQRKQRLGTPKEAEIL
jgi:hypothetical protein